MPQAGRGVTGQDRPGRLRGGQRSGRTENRLMSAREVLVRIVLAGFRSPVVILTPGVVPTAVTGTSRWNAVEVRSEVLRKWCRWLSA